MRVYTTVRQRLFRLEFIYCVCLFLFVIAPQGKILGDNIPEFTSNLSENSFKPRSGGWVWSFYCVCLFCFCDCPAGKNLKDNIPGYTFNFK